MNNTMIRIYTRAVYVSRIAIVNLAVLLLGIEIYARSSSRSGIRT